MAELAFPILNTIILGSGFTVAAIDYMRLKSKDDGDTDNS